jgi:hypothetical protein
MQSEMNAACIRRGLARWREAAAGGLGVRFFLTFQRKPTALPTSPPPPPPTNAGVFGSQGNRDDFEAVDIDYYFEYTGSLAVRFFVSVLFR